MNPNVYQQVHVPYKYYKIGKFRISEIEIKELLKAWIILSLAFGIVLAGGFRGLMSLAIVITFIISALTVGIGFLVHEMAHKFVAQKYRCIAEFRAFNQMLFLAVIMSFFGFIFAAPGAVMIAGHVNRKQNGHISLAGPMANFVIAILFVLIGFVSLNPLLAVISRYGFMINVWLGLFNLIPVWNFDGRKILGWNKKIYGLVVALGIVLLILQPVIF